MVPGVLWLVCEVSLALQKYWFKIRREPPPCLFQVYHVSSDSYETQNQHYGRSLTKETVKDGKGIGVSELGALGFFHLNTYL